MVRPAECCNPLRKQNHKCVRKNLFLVTNKWSSKCKNLIGLYVCNHCRRDLYRSNREEFIPETPQQAETVEEAEVDDLQKAEAFEELEVEDLYEAATENYKSDPTFECKAVENAMKFDKINALLEEIGEPTIKKPRFSKLCEQNKLNISEIIRVPGNNNDIENAVSEEESEFINGIRAALSNADTRLEKIQILTTVPPHWTIKKIRDKLRVSRRMVRHAKKLRKDKGHGSLPEKKHGREISDSTIATIHAFYSSEDNSRVLPGIKDYVSIKENGQRTHVQKTLLLFNVNELHEKFKKENPEVSISLSKFQELRPKECISAGQKGTHNVCVCKTHENTKLKIVGIKQELQKKGVNFSQTYHDFIEKCVCDVSEPICFFSECEKCPGTEAIMNELKHLFEKNSILEIKYSQWSSTDR